MYTKKFFLICIMLVLIVSAAYSGQFNYRYSSDEVQTLLVLSRLSGTALPQMTYPVTAEVLKNLLSRIDTQKLSKEALELYSDLEQKLNPSFLVEEKSSGFDLSLPILIGEFSNDDGFLGYKDQKPLFSLNADVQITDYFAAEVDFDFRAEKDLGKNFRSLITLKDSVSHDYPTKAYGSLGFSTVNLSIGRDRLSAGNGVTGNLELSENLLYQDYAKFSVLGGNLSYDFTVLIYDKPLTETKIERYNFTNYTKSAFIHRFSSVFAKKVSVTLYEGAMVYGRGVIVDPRVLNPMMMIHNTFTYMHGNVNNFFGLDVNAKLPYGLSLNFHGIIDQLKLGDEGEDSGKNAFGILANLEGTWTVGKGILSAYTEFVYTNSYLYLQESEDHFNEGDFDEYFDYFKIDLVSAYRYFHESHNEQAYIGYPYGPDLKLFTVGASYILKGITYSAAASFRIKGEFGIDTENDESRSIWTHPENNRDEKTFGIALGAKGKVSKGFDCAVMLGYSYSGNYKHRDENYSRVQCAISVTIDPLEFVRR